MSGRTGVLTRKSARRRAASRWACAWTSGMRGMVRGSMACGAGCAHRAAARAGRAAPRGWKRRQVVSRLVHSSLPRVGMRIERSKGQSIPRAIEQVPRGHMRMMPASRREARAAHGRSSRTHGCRLRSKIPRRRSSGVQAARNAQPFFGRGSRTGRSLADATKRSLATTNEGPHGLTSAGEAVT